MTKEKHAFCFDWAPNEERCDEHREKHALSAACAAGRHFWGPSPIGEKCHDCGLKRY